jgi:hypothetical protein
MQSKPKPKCVHGTPHPEFWARVFAANTAHLIGAAYRG